MDLSKSLLAVIVIAFAASCSSGPIPISEPSSPSLAHRDDGELLPAVPAMYLAASLTTAVPASPLPITVAPASVPPMLASIRRVSVLHDLHSSEFYQTIMHAGTFPPSRFARRPYTAVFRVFESTGRLHDQQWL